MTAGFGIGHRGRRPIRFESRTSELPNPESLRCHAFSISTASPARRATWCSARCSTPGCRSRSCARRWAAWRIDGASVSATQGAARGVSATKFSSTKRRPTHAQASDHAHDHHSMTHAHARPCTAHVAHEHGHRSLAEINALIDRSALSRGGQGAREGAVSASRRSRSGDPSGADREDPSPRGGRSRFDHRHRRRGVRPRVVRRRSHRVVAVECRRRHGEVRPRVVPRAGASHGQAARRAFPSTPRASRASW